LGAGAAGIGIGRAIKKGLQSQQVREFLATAVKKFNAAAPSKSVLGNNLYGVFRTKAVCVSGGDKLGHGSGGI
jgi:hypothetical protein